MSTSVNFRAAGTPSVNFRQLSVPPGDLMLTFCHGGRTSVKFVQCYVQPGGLLSIFVSIPRKRDAFCQHLPTFCAAWRPSVNFCRHSVRPGDFLSISIFRTPENFRHLSPWEGDLPSASVNFLCCQETFCQLPSNFCAGGRPSVNFRQHFMRPQDYLSIFRATGRTSVNFR